MIRMNNHKIYYSIQSQEAVGMILKITNQKNLQTLEIKGKERVLVQINDPKETYHLGDYIKVQGEFTIPNENRTENLFNYKTYLNRKNIYYIVKAKNIEIIKNNRNILYKLKDIIKQHLGNSPYLNTFLIGDKSYLSKNVIRSYQENGISHLFAISGMHISILAGILEKLLKRKTEEKRFLIIAIILWLYLLIVGFSPSILRGVLFYIFFSINRIWYFYIKPINIVILVTSISLLLKTEFIWDIGFQYSYLISLSLLLSKDYLKENSYFLSLLKISFISFLVSIPISIYHFYQVNLLGIIYNLFYVPFVSIILFPMSILVFIFPFLNPIYEIMTTILEETSLFLSEISIFKIVFKRINIIIYFIYMILILLFLILKQKRLLILYLVLLFFHTQIPFFENKNYIEFIDVGQGDSILLHYKRDNILLDTGASSENNTVFYNTLNPLLKSKGINKLTLIISHGDDDHMGEAINLVNNFKVEKVIFNCGEFNDLEKELIEVLDKKHIKYYSCIKELNVDNNKLYFLQTEYYDNENDNSNVIYTELNSYKFMFMGDAGVDKEKDILQNYNMSNIDVLKVGHHGSKTSSSKEFIDKVKPKYSIISVGKNNRYGHPNKEVLNNLENSKIYRTDQDGSIMFKIKNNKLQIETCSP